MWVISGIGIPVPLVWENVFDRPEGQHDEGEHCSGGVEAVAPVHDEPHSSIEALVSGVVDPEPHRGHDARSAFAYGLGQGDEGCEPAALCSRAEPVEECGDLVL